MVKRLANLSTKQSFFLFGARGTGKTSLVKDLFSQDSFYIDLLNLDTEARYQLDPESLFKELSGLPANIHTVIIDEIQKAPKLLDVVHRKIESTDLQFILTGSSARKLKLGAANLLAGRAVVFNLYPLLASELGSSFQLIEALTYGTLPKVTNLSDGKEKKRFLLAYANTYLKEEVWGEQLVRKIEPFRRFLQVAAQIHGQQINFSKLSREVGVDDSTIKTYYSILEDTLIGFYLPAYAGSERKKLQKAPKFYLFDNGVKRALEGVVDYDLVPGTFEYGILFEQFIISELTRITAYKELSLTFSFLATEGGAEVDLVIERGRRVIALIEIKSGKRVLLDQLKHISSLGKDFHGAKLFCLYDGDVPYVEGEVQVLPWQQGIEAVLGVVER